VGHTSCQQKRTRRSFGLSKAGITSLKEKGLQVIEALIFLVETGESPTLSAPKTRKCIVKILEILRQRGALVVVFR